MSDLGIAVWMIISIEHDQTRIASRQPTTLLKIFDRARRPTTTEDDGVLLDATHQRRIDATGPTSENFAIAGAFDIEDELAIAPASLANETIRTGLFSGIILGVAVAVSSGVTVASGIRPGARLASFRIFGQHAWESSLPPNTCHLECPSAIPDLMKACITRSKRFRNRVSRTQGTPNTIPQTDSHLRILVSKALGRKSGFD